MAIRIYKYTIYLIYIQRIHTHIILCVNNNWNSNDFIADAIYCDNLEYIQTINYHAHSLNKHLNESSELFLKKKKKCFFIQQNDLWFVFIKIFSIQCCQDCNEIKMKHLIVWYVDVSFKHVLFHANNIFATILYWMHGILFSITIINEIFIGLFRLDVFNHSFHYQTIICCNFVLRLHVAKKKKKYWQEHLIRVILNLKWIISWNKFVVYVLRNKFEHLFSLGLQLFIQ